MTEFATGDTLYGVKIYPAGPRIVTATIARVTAKMLHVGRGDASGFSERISRDSVGSGAPVAAYAPALFQTEREALSCFRRIEAAQAAQHQQLVEWANAELDRAEGK